jgi:hypothetical protein
MCGVCFFVNSYIWPTVQWQIPFGSLKSKLLLCVWSVLRATSSCFSYYRVIVCLLFNKHAPREYTDARHVYIDAQTCKYTDSQTSLWTSFYRLLPKIPRKHHVCLLTSFYRLLPKITRKHHVCLLTYTLVYMLLYTHIRTFLYTYIHILSKTLTRT